MLQGIDLTTAGQAQLRSLRGNRMAMVYQDAGSALNPSLTVGRQIAEVYRFHGGLDGGAAMEAAGAMLETVQIADPARMLRRYPHELSGGQQQRVMFAMALATNPDLLVLDEPTTGLDTTVEAEVLDLVSRLRSKFSASILFISHNLGIVARMCERVGVLYAGRLIEEGPSREIFSDPRHPYTLGLSRCVPNRHHAQGRASARPDRGFPAALGSRGRRLRLCSALPHRAAALPRRGSSCLRFRREPREPLLLSRRGSAHPARACEALAERSAPTARAEELLRVEDLSKRYGVGANQVVALDDVSIELEAGEILGLVGESGSGKSTLAKCVVGLLEASGGEIDFAGRAAFAARGLAKARTAPQAADGVPEPRHHAQSEPYGPTHSHARRAASLRPAAHRRMWISRVASLAAAVQSAAASSRSQAVLPLGRAQAARRDRARLRRLAGARALR